MKIKTHELAGPALRYAVAVALKWNGGLEAFNLPLLIEQHGFRPDLLWELGGPIIEREGIATRRALPLSGQWEADCCNYRKMGVGPTLLIAAMRCFIATSLGAEVDIPDRLMP